MVWLGKGRKKLIQRGKQKVKEKGLVVSLLYSGYGNYKSAKFIHETVNDDIVVVNEGGDTFYHYTKVW